MTDTPTPIRQFGDMERLYDALATAQAEFLPIAKNKTADAGKFKYRYADLADVMAAIRPALAKYGLTVVQPTWILGDRMHVTTRLAHRSGAWIESDYPVAGIAGGLAHQVVGAALSYARRYGVSSLLSIAAEDDLDAGGTQGQEISGKAPWPEKAANSGPPRPRQNPPAESVRTDGAAQTAAGVAAGPAPARASHGTSAPAAQAKPSLIDVNDPLIVDMRKHMENSDQLRRWHKENKEKIDAKGEEWTNEFYPRYDASMTRLMAKEKEAAPAATVQ